MAIKLNFYLNGKRIKEPLNYQELGIELNFDKDDPNYRGQLNINEWVIGLGDNQDDQDGTNEIKNYIREGLTGGKGIFEGLSFRIDLEDAGAIDTLFDGYLDLSQGQFTCHQIQAPSIDNRGIDWFNDAADSVTFEKMFDDGFITPDDFAKVPYQEFKQGDKVQVALIILSVVTIAFLVWEFVKQLISVIKNFKGWDVGQKILELVDLLITLIQLIINIAIFVKQIFRYFTNPIKYKTAMYLVDMCRIGAEYLGFDGFQSSIFDADSKYRYNSSLGWGNVVLIPETYNTKVDPEDGLTGVQLIRDLIKKKFYGVYRGTYGDFLRELKTMFNAKIIIQNNVLKLERIDEDLSVHKYQIPQIDTYDTPFRYNSEDLNSYYNISFTPDIQDKVNLQNYGGTEIQIFTKAISEGLNPITKGELINQIGFGLTVIKRELTPQEKFIKGVVSIWYGFISLPLIILKGVLKVVNNLIKLIKKIVKALKTAGIFKKSVSLKKLRLGNITHPLDAFKGYYDNLRLGILLFESDYITQPKLVALEKNYEKARVGGEIISGNTGIKPHSNQRDLLDAEFLYEKFHYINNFIEDEDLATQDHNQHLIYELNGIDFCIEDYKLVKQDNKIFSFDGKKGEIISLKWNVYEQTADISYKVKEKYTNNLKIEKIKGNGR